LAQLYRQLLAPNLQSIRQHATPVMFRTLASIQ
jgi:hypothetical protein